MTKLYPMNQNSLREILAEETRRHWTIEAAAGIEQHDDSPSSRAGLAAMRRAYMAAIEDCLHICGENDSAERAANDIRDYQTHVSGQV